VEPLSVGQDIGVGTVGAVGALAPTNFWMGGQCPHKKAGMTIKPVVLKAQNLSP